MAGWPRVGISFPLFLAIIPYLFHYTIKSGIAGWWNWVAGGATFLIIYLFVLWLFPPKLVKKNYNKWLKEYNDKTSLWFYLYFLVLPIIFIAIRVYLWTN